MRYERSTLMPVALCFVLSLALPLSPAWAQKKMSAEDEAIYRNMMKSTGIDPGAGMDARAKVDASRQWTEGNAGVVDYHIVGVYQGQPNITSEPGKGSGYADVTDRVVIDLKWKLSEAQLVGTPSIQNSKTVLTNPHYGERSCLPPILKGDYEHYELLAVKNGLGGALELQVQTTYPVVDVVQFCTGSRKSIPAGRKTRAEELVVPSPVMFGMTLPDSDDLRISPDKKSLVHKRAGWTWTFTPSVKK
jgi:hypothetical protein